MAFTGKFMYTILSFYGFLRFDPFDVRVDREGWWFEHCVS